jgi:hypothetical protein
MYTHVSKRKNDEINKLLLCLCRQKWSLSGCMLFTVMITQHEDDDNKISNQNVIVQS